MIKKKYLSLLLMNLHLIGILSSQELDTLVKDFGGYIVYEKADLAREKEILGGLYESSPGLRQFKNYKVYNETDSLLKEVKTTFHPNSDYSKSTWIKGVKTEEIYSTNDSIWRMKTWNEKGFLTADVLKIKETLVVTEYYGDKMNNIKMIVHKRKSKTVSEKLENEKLEGDIWIDNSGFNDSWIPYGDVIELHPSGKTKSIKRYYPQSVITKTGFNYFLKHGTWEYYDEKGDLTKIEHYKKGERIRKE